MVYKYTMEIITKEQAQTSSLVKYYTGLPCKNGHLDFRYTNTGICYACKRSLNRGCNFRNKDTLKKISRKSYLKNKKSCLARSKKWVENNRDKSNKIKSAYRKRNIEKVRLSSREYQNKKRQNPEYRISKAISKALWNFLKGGKANKHWESVLNFTLETLLNHLKQKFRDGMTLENYGTYWHVDHIKPLCKCSNLEEAWNLNNLQPLLVFENLSKNKYKTWRKR